jgi:hypothetical protein
MGPSPPPRRPLRAAVALAALVASGTLGSICGYNQEIWLCLNPVTGKEDGNWYDTNHYVNGVADPCHCYDPCGPEKSCPIVVDAGPPGPGCETGDAGDGGP